MAGGRFLLGVAFGAIGAAVALVALDRRNDLQTLEIAGFTPARLLDGILPASDFETPPPEAESVFAPEPAPEPDLALEPLAAPEAIELAPAPLAPPSVTLVPELAYPGILYDWTGAEALAPFTVVTSPGYDYYVKLLYEGTSTAAIGIYVQGGISNEVLIPLGRYEMRYASGTTWYGLSDLFGPETAYAKALDVLDFREEDNQYKGYTVELILQEGGNLDTLGLSPSEF